MSGAREESSHRSTLGAEVKSVRKIRLSWERINIGICSRAKPQCGPTRRFPADRRSRCGFNEGAFRFHLSFDYVEEGSS